MDIRELLLHLNEHQKEAIQFKFSLDQAKFKCAVLFGTTKNAMFNQLFATLIRKRKCQHRRGLDNFCIT